MHKLSSWLLLAVLLTAAVAWIVAGFHPGALFALLQVPAVLAALLLARAAVLVLQGRPFALQWRGRSVLGGKLGLWLPALFVVGWTFVRENGWFDANCCASRSDHRSGAVSQGWRDLTKEPLLPGVVVNAPANAFGAGIHAALPDHWMIGDHRLAAAVTIPGDAPFRPWPLYKSAALGLRITVVLQMQPQREDGVVRTSSIEFEVDGTWTTYGFSSQRHHHLWIGRTIGELLHKAIGKHAATAFTK